MGTIKAEKHIYTVKQVNNYVRQLFDGDFILRNISVKGEISNCKYHSSGHIYFSLKDSSGVISCVMFASDARSLTFRLEDGMQVVISGNVSIYEAAGKYQLYAKRVSNDGVGELYQKYEELKSRLEEAGYFSDIYKKPLPQYASKIGVVTAQTGAVIKDIFNVSSRRNPYVQIYLYPSQVQGEGAAESIVRGIKKLDAMGLDIIIIGRGGGSIEDLWAFNEEIVARAVFECETPLISAVGHETDFTIADFVADMRAPTPSAAAELAVFDFEQFEQDLRDKKYTLELLLENKIRRYSDRIKNYRLTIETLSPENMLLQKKQRASEIRDILDSMMEDKVSRNRDIADEIRKKLNDAVNEKFRLRKERLGIISERLSGLSPLKRLSEGYAYVSKEGKRLKSVSQTKTGDIISVSLSDGSLEAQVKSVDAADRFT